MTTTVGTALERELRTTESGPRKLAAGEIALTPEVERLRDRLVAVRRDLHRHPEPGFKEVRTAGIVAARLRELGCRVQTGIAQTGVVGEIGNGGGKTLLLRFDMDALPVHEATGAAYASTVPGWMHACGHDGHTSVGLAVAEALIQDPLPGTVKLVFQPAQAFHQHLRHLPGSCVTDNSTH
ncbi:MAG: M20/M25/M40 family metallo-hydrolase [Chloroflexi bacterium]|nr:M20/M25/M40 family metallo-hydrolase [Chloroflexota bacterium]